MPDPLEVSLDTTPTTQPVVEATSEFPVEATSEIPIQATSERPLAATAELLTDGSADPHSAHSPMSPDDQVSDKHTGLSFEPHTTAGTTPQS